MKFLHIVLHAWICSSIFWFIVYGNLNRICILLLFENCINLNYAELVHDAFSSLLYPSTFCIFILLIFESLILKLQLFLGAPKSLQMVIAAMKLKDAYPLEGKLGPT